MNKMKRYACHRLFFSQDKFFRQSVVAVDGEGKVLEYKPMVEEMDHTEWLGGIIILSPLWKYDRKGDFLTTLHDLTKNVGQPLYAWHLSDFDYVHNTCTQTSVLRLLHGSSSKF